MANGELGLDVSVNQGVDGVFLHGGAPRNSVVIKVAGAIGILKVLDDFREKLGLRGWQIRGARGLERAGLTVAGSDSGGTGKEIAEVHGSRRGRRHGVEEGGGRAGRVSRRGGHGRK
eukprot:759939-Hanusia_phi.AAC.1